MASEERASGISPPEMKETDEAIETIIGMTQTAEEELMAAEGEKREVKEKEKETAENVRKRSMEWLSESKERKIDGRVKKQRLYSGAETISFLHSKGATDSRLREEEVELKRRELDLREKELERLCKERRSEREMRMRGQFERQRRENMLIEQHQQMLGAMQQLVQQIKDQNSAILKLVKLVIPTMVIIQKSFSIWPPTFPQ